MAGAVAAGSSSKLAPGNLATTGLSSGHRPASASPSSPTLRHRGGSLSSTIRSVSVSDTSTTEAVADLPLKEIPGSYGLPFFGALKDRLDFTVFQQLPEFYTSRRDKYGSTVYRTNVAPGPPFYPDPRVVVVLDEKSYQVLFDVSKVWKKDIFVGTYVPSVKLTGGYRILSYLDPSEPKHETLKNFAFELLKRTGSRVLPELTAAIGDVCTSWAATLKKDGKVTVQTELQPATFKFIVKSVTQRDPYKDGENSIGTNGSTDSNLWTIGSIGPITVIPNLPWYLVPIVELFLHTLPLPAFPFKFPYNKLVKFFRTYGGELLDFAEKDLGLEREEALHNMVFLTCFNAWGGVNLLFPSVVKRLGQTSVEYQKELSAEVVKALKDNGGQLTFKALGAMPLVESAVYEVLRIDPPVPFQYGKAKEDMVIQSHDASFQIKKGETLAGYMPIACRDPKIFEDPESFLPKRFVGEDGQALLKYVLWSNGPQTEKPTVQNKHCPGKDFITFITRAFVATLYSNFDTLQLDSSGDITVLSTASH